MKQQQHGRTHLSETILVQDGKSRLSRRPTEMAVLAKHVCMRKLGDTSRIHLEDIPDNFAFRLQSCVEYALFN